jgi:hypothetical protein
MRVASRLGRSNHRGPRDVSARAGSESDDHAHQGYCTRSCAGRSHRTKDHPNGGLPVSFARVSRSDGTATTAGQPGRFGLA